MDVNFTYPNSDLDRPDFLLSLLGSFWSGTYGGRDVVEATMTAGARAVAQAHLDLADMIASMSRFNVPIFHRENWHFLLFKDSEVNKILPKIKRYTDLRVISPPDFHVGVPLDSRLFAVPCPKELKEVPVILNRITEPSLTLIQGIDYWVEDGYIYFRNDPFKHDLLPVQEIWADGRVVDWQAGLWLYHGKYDWHTTYQQFGYALRAYGESSENYKQMINAVLDSAIFATTNSSVESAMSAITGIPLAHSSREVVEFIGEDCRALHVITDKKVYSFPTGSKLLTKVGDTLEVGQPIVDTLQFVEFSRGQVNPDILDALVVGPGLLNWGYYSDLAFENKELPLTAIAEHDGTVKVRFPIGGFPGDIEKFWNDIDHSGFGNGKTLAQMLDTRAVQDTPTTAASLPATINPFMFLVENVLRYNAFVVRIKASRISSDALGLWNMWFLKRVIPPYMLMIPIIELEPREELVIMDGPGDETRPGYSETVTSFPCALADDTINPVAMIQESVRGFQIGGRCE